MGNEIILISIEELLNRSAEILSNQKHIMEKLEIKKED